MFEDEAFSFYGTALGGQQKQKERWKRVLAAATREIGEPVARLYVDAAFSASAKARCEELVTGLEFPISVDGAQGMASGWYISPEREFSLDLKRGEVISGGKKWPVSHVWS